MRASEVLLLLMLSLGASCAHGRTLKQGGSVFTPPVIGVPMTPTSAASPWANFTREPQTLYIGIKTLNSSIAANDEECASLCNDDSQCEYWSWCPANMTSGCGIPAANATYSSTVPAGGCILSWDDAKDRQALFLAFGKSVPFMAGEYNPQNSTAPASNSSSAGGGSGGGIHPSVRRLLQGGTDSSGDVWTNFTRAANRFNQGIDGLPTISTQTAEQCADACNADKYCEFWSLCPPAVGATGCEVPSFTPNASPQVVPAGTCVLSYDGTRDQMAYFLMLGKAVLFEGGKWNASSSTTNPSTPATNPAVILPPIPGLSTAPTSPASNSSGPGPTPIPFVPPLTGNSPSSNNTSNGTLPNGGDTTNSSSVVIYTSWVRAYGSAPAWCDSWNGTTFVSSESLGNGFLATGGNGTISQADVETYVTQRCAARSAAGETIAADLLAGGESARKAFVATLSTCTAGSQGLLQDFANFINPNGNTDADKVARYATAWTSAGDELGVATCVTIVVVDREQGKATEQKVHPPTMAPIS